MTPVAFRYATCRTEPRYKQSHAMPLRPPGPLPGRSLRRHAAQRHLVKKRLLAAPHARIPDGRHQRDHLPWAGDLASMMVNAYTFADREIVRRTIAMLGREGIAQTDINDIADYSLWWLIAQGRYQLFFGDRLHLQREWPRIKKPSMYSESRCNQNGILTDSIRWLFIDWSIDEGKRLAGALVVGQQADPHQERMGTNSWRPIGRRNPTRSKAAARTRLRSRAAGMARQTRRESKTNRHANFLVYRVLTPSAIPLSILGGYDRDRSEPLHARIRIRPSPGWCSRTDAEADERVLGGMIAQGATSFWEGYDANEDEVNSTVFWASVRQNPLPAWAAARQR